MKGRPCGKNLIFAISHVCNYIISHFLKHFNCVLLALEIGSRLDPDPGNHGRKKWYMDQDEIVRRISPHENLGRSFNTLKQLFKLGKDARYNIPIQDIVKKIGGTDPAAKPYFSSFTLLSEGIPCLDLYAVFLE